MRRFLAAVAFLVASCAGAPPSQVCPDRRDDAETPAEAAQGDACHRAGLRLAKLGCPEARPDWDAFCHNAVENSVPLCPTKLARIKSCSEVADVCR